MLQDEENIKKMKFFQKCSYLGGLYWTERGFFPIESLRNLQILIFSHVHNLFPLTFCFCICCSIKFAQLPTAVFATFFELFFLGSVKNSYWFMNEII
jgi:hypothetical protein